MKPFNVSEYVFGVDPTIEFEANIVFPRCVVRIVEARFGRIVIGDECARLAGGGTGALLDKLLLIEFIGASPAWLLPKKCVDRTEDETVETLSSSKSRVSKSVNVKLLACKVCITCGNLLSLTCLLLTLC